MRIFSITDKCVQVIFTMMAAMAFTIAHGVEVDFTFAMDGAQDGGGARTGLGSGVATLDLATNTLTYSMAYSGLSGTENGAHFHGPAVPGVNAAVLYGLPAGSPKSGSINLVALSGGTYTVAQQIDDLLHGKWYVNVHSTTFPGGEIRGQLYPKPITFNISLDAAQDGGGARTGTGTGTATLNPVNNQLSYNITFSGLSGTENGAHFHGPAAPGVNAAVLYGLPAGSPKSGTVNLIDKSSGAYTVAMQIIDVLNNLWYVNVHSTTFPGGEIRGQLLYQYIADPFVPVTESTVVPSGLTWLEGFDNGGSTEYEYGTLSNTIEQIYFWDDATGTWQLNTPPDTGYFLQSDGSLTYWEDRMIADGYVSGGETLVVKPTVSGSPISNAKTMYLELETTSLSGALMEDVLDDFTIGLSQAATFGVGAQLLRGKLTFQSAIYDVECDEEWWLSSGWSGVPQNANCYNFTAAAFGPNSVTLASSLDELVGVNGSAAPTAGDPYSLSVGQGTNGNGYYWVRGYFRSDTGNANGANPQFLFYRVYQNGLTATELIINASSHWSLTSYGSVSLIDYTIPDAVIALGAEVWIDEEDVNGFFFVDTTLDTPSAYVRSGTIMPADTVIYEYFLNASAQSQFLAAFGLAADDDSDGMPDLWEDANGLNPAIDDSALDLDGDGYTNIAEFLAGTDPQDDLDYPVATNIATTDLDIDGDSDIFWRRADLGQSLVWEMEAGVRTAVNDLGYSSTGLSVMGLGDFNDDGDSDVLLRNVSTGEFVVIAIEDTLQQSRTSIGYVATSLNFKAIGDVDADGDEDVILRDEATGEFKVMTMENHAKVGVTSLGYLATSLAFKGLGDVDMDGDKDIVLRNDSTGEIKVRILDAGAGVSTPSFGYNGTAFTFKAILDADADSDDDILLRNDATGQMLVVISDNGTKLQTNNLGYNGTALSFTGIGDMDADGGDDILLRNNSTGENVRVLLQGGLSGGNLSLGYVGTAYTYSGRGDFDGDGDDDFLFRYGAYGANVRVAMEAGAKSAQTLLEYNNAALVPYLKK